MTVNCPVCVPKTVTVAKTPSKLRYLRYKIYTSNMRELLDGMYAKDPRQNLHVELGYSDAPDSPDRFYADEYDQVVSDILNTPLEYPPDEG